MKRKSLRVVLKIFKWTVIIVCSFYFLGISIFGIKRIYPDGTYSAWSGLDALWESDEDFGVFRNRRMKAELEGMDGPYVLQNFAYTIDSINVLHSKRMNKTDSLIVRVKNTNGDQFYIRLKNELRQEKDVYEMPEKLIAVSDIEGNFNGFSSFLISNQVMDTNFNWIFGNGHLVLNGDFVDRGNDVPQVLWLIYKLEEQAQLQSGKVHYILGNHEIMNMQGQWKYNKRKYIRAAQLISKETDWDKATKFIYSDKTELGKWLRTKNVIEQIGNYIFVHAGLSPEILRYDLSISKINAIIKQNSEKDLYNHPSDDEVANFLMGKEGPFWYRGLVTDYKYYDKITETELNEILTAYHVEKIVIGHTVMDDITTGFGGSVINLDVKHGQEKNTGKTKGMLIENGVEYRISDKGAKEKM